MKCLYLLSLLLLGVSCVGDTGNYEYVSTKDILPVTISGLPDKYSVVRSERLHFAPEVDIENDSERYTYSWFITEGIADSTRPSRRYLADTKDLDYRVLLNAGVWKLSFEVIDRERDIYKRHEIQLTITATPISLGWYVLKDINDETDFDFVNKEGEMYVDVLKSTDSQLAGKAVSMLYQPGQYYQLFPNGDGTSTLLGNQKVFHILSTKDIRVFDARSMALFKTFEDVFYIAPEQCNPQEIARCSSSALFLLNAGKVHSIYTMSPHYGKFADPKLGNYSFFERMIAGGSVGVLVFDTKTNSFCSIIVNSPTVDSVPDKPVESTVNGPTSVTNMPYSLVKMEIGESTSSGVSAFALMKHVSTGEYYLAQLLYKGLNAYPIVDFNLVPNEYLLPDADLIAVPAIGDFVYFTKDNKVYTYIGASAEVEKQRLLLEFAPNEKVTYIKHFCYPTAPTDYSYLAVLTNVDSKWKLRIYTPTGVGEIGPGIVAEYEGEGNGRYVMYRN
ncbi:MAG TPA: hypothetical protein K8W04_08410 [Bacteroides reticulotermitis]|nr:hypothetical protein [Bacteroides reticulotermitis]